ncbi:MAG: hypothetical protein Harvfovirus27_3 [Harvfovirus sp.]|uniref:Uncharacterized protein n=1 Tax=Harvfovirus sp. TaxID=2487768 RepID=A0A3G5A4A7_9VIRU|nr:MAG: hypothetical protein Harvfovirus27_3 [Harvfovirus sp.]
MPVYKCNNNNNIPYSEYMGKCNINCPTGSDPGVAFLKLEGDLPAFSKGQIIAKTIRGEGPPITLHGLITENTEASITLEKITFDAQVSVTPFPPVVHVDREGDEYYYDNFENSIVITQHGVIRGTFEVYYR